MVGEWRGPTSKRTPVFWIERQAESAKSQAWGTSDLMFPGWRRICNLTSLVSKYKSVRQYQGGLFCRRAPRIYGESRKNHSKSACKRGREGWESAIESRVVETLKGKTVSVKILGS